MNNILRLIAKDLRLQRSFVLPLIALEVGGYLAYVLQIPSGIPGVAFGLLHGVALIGDFLVCYRTMIAEEKNRAFLFVKTLPVSTSEIVLAKFGVNLLLVSLNLGVLLASWGSAHALGWVHVQPVLTPPLVLASLTLHCLNNAFFVAISLVFSSERAVWVPFPAIFVAMSVILNFHKITVALHLQPIVDALQDYGWLSDALLWLVIAGLVCVSAWAMEHKRLFA